MQLTADSHNQMLEFIRVQPPFRTLSEPELILIDQTAEASQVEQGTHILSQGGPPSQYLYLIREGAVRYVRDGQVIQVLEEGELFGYPSMLSQEAAGANVIAEEPLSLYRIPEKTFRELIDNAQFAEYFLKNIVLCPHPHDNQINIVFLNCADYRIGQGAYFNICGKFDYVFEMVNFLGFGGAKINKLFLNFLSGICLLKRGLNGNHRDIQRSAFRENNVKHFYGCVHFISKYQSMLKSILRIFREISGE